MLGRPNIPGPIQSYNDTAIPTAIPWISNHSGLQNNSPNLPEIEIQQSVNIIQQNIQTGNFPYGLGRALNKAYEIVVQSLPYSLLNGAFSKVASAVSYFNQMTILPGAEATSLATSQEKSASRKVKAVKTSQRDLKAYKMPDEKLFVAGYDIALTMKGLEIIPESIDEMNPFPKVPLHRDKVAELIKNNKIDEFNALISDAVNLINKELGKAGRFRNIIITQYQELSQNKSLTKNNLIIGISRQLSKYLGIKESKVINAMSISAAKAAATTHYNEFMEGYLSNEFYQSIKGVLLTPHIESLRQSQEQLQIQFKKLNNAKLNQQPKQLIEKYRTSEEKAILEEKYDDRLNKVALLVSAQRIPYVLFDRQRMDAPASAEVIINDNIVGHFIDKKDGEFYKQNSVTHEPIHVYEDGLCLGASITRNHPKTAEFFEPCGNNIKKHINLPKTLQSAFKRDYDKYKKFMATGPEIRSKVGYFTADDFKELSAKYHYPQIKKDKIASVTGKIHTAFDMLWNMWSNPVEIIPNITQEMNPEELLAYAPNTAYIRSFTIHDDGRPQTRLYMNLLQGNYTTVKHLVKENPGILDQKYDGIPLIDIAKIIKDYDKVLFKDIKLSAQEPNQYRNICNWVTKEYKKPQERTRLRDEL